ncbi:unnamed protein product [Protopolystoma xenopodis]|uniref:Reverse transcriptase domain-containing protein n=1 Tax=Protopolystoma xenopodis TaxID=117903 RepID=A0A448WFP0_9PLAT|nr:unnamed protein product [Protopolystoma xenopodis]
MSLDVQSMYKDISDEKAVSALLEILEREDDILEAERVRKESLTRLINLTIRTTYFIFNGSIYEQIFGLPIGSPLPPLLTNVYMDKLERVFEKSPLQPRVLMPYLDDYFALWSHGKENLNELLNFINEFDERIKFTMEVEEDERLPFMGHEETYRLKIGILKSLIIRS